MNREILEKIYNRKSTSSLVEPSPKLEDIEQMIKLASSVPDHGKLSPYKFSYFSGEARAKFGDALASSAKDATDKATESMLEKLRDKAFKAPSLIAIVCDYKKSKIPKWEQEATAACTGYAIVTAAHLLGYGAVWKSSKFDANEQMRSLLGMKEDDSLLGWVNLGSVNEEHFSELREDKDYKSLLQIHS